MRFPINKNANIEIENNVLKYRIPITEVDTDDLVVIEKNLKRKILSIDSDKNYLVPFDIQTINSSLILYYEMTHFRSFDFIKQLPFKDKLKYFLSLIDIATKHQTTKVLWDKHNFVVDEHEESFKVVVYETPDIKIYENDDEFKGVKDLIILSLTTLNKVLGKPKLQDFIDSDNDIIQFTEQLLKIDNLEDLGHYISTKQIEYEHGMNESDGEGSKKIKVTSSKKKVSFNIKPKSKVTTNAPKANRSKNKKSSGSDKGMKKWILLASVGIPLAFILNVMAPDIESDTGTNNKSNGSNSSVTKESSSKSNGDPKYNDDLLDAYRLSLADKNEEAIEILETIGYENLSKEDKLIMQTIYEEVGQISKVIDMNPKRAKEIVNAIVANNQNDKLMKLQQDLQNPNPYVDFEIAYVNQEWNKIIELKDKVDLNGRKEEQIVDAYIGLGEYKEGIKFAEKVGDPALLEKIKSLSTLN